MYKKWTIVVLSDEKVFRSNANSKLLVYKPRNYMKLCNEKQIKWRGYHIGARYFPTDRTIFSVLILVNYNLYIDIIERDIHVLLLLGANDDV